MRKINPHDFKVARRGTTREINRQIALNLIRTDQPISRADLARLMNVRRGVASLLVSELLSESLIFEGALGEAVGRGRRPTAPSLHRLVGHAGGRATVSRPFRMPVAVRPQRSPRSRSGSDYPKLPMSSPAAGAFGGVAATRAVR